jgi:hypothetical protein
MFWTLKKLNLIDSIYLNYSFDNEMGNLLRKKYRLREE